MNKALSQVTRKRGDSHFWAGLIEIKDQFLSMGTFEVHNGKKARFWEDVWIGKVTLRERYTSLYNIARRKDDTVAKICGSVPLSVSFRRALTGHRLNKWLELVTEIATHGIDEQEDKFIWNLNKNKVHSKINVHEDNAS